MTRFTWIGTVSGAWQTAGSWDDITDALDPSLTAPGSADAASIAGPGTGVLSIGGAGQAAALATTGNVAVTGTLGITTLSVNGGTLAIGAGGTLAAGTAAVVGDLAVGGAGAVFSSTGSVALDANIAGMDLANGGVARLGGLSMAATNSYVSVDATSVLQIGTVAGTAGALTVDAGATLSEGNASTLFASAIFGAVIDQGRIVAAALDFGNQLFQPGTAGFGPASSLAGTGTIEAVAGGAIGFGAAIAAGSLTIQADTGASLRFDSTVGAGNRVVLSGSQDIVQISGTAGIGFAGGITGFNTTDALVISGPSITGATAASGTLSLFNGTSLVGAVPLAAAVTGQLFTVSSEGSLLTQIVLASGSGSGTISPGTTTADDYVWTGPLAGAWNNAANWRDLSANQNPATIAPGSLDLVSIAGPGNTLLYVTGGGRSASLAVSGDVAVTGALSTGTLTAGTGTLEVTAGATLAAAAATGTTAIVAQGSAALLTVSGTLSLAGDLAALTASGGADIVLGGLALTGADPGVSVDAASTLEIGTAGTTAGGVVVDPEATLQVAGSNALMPAYLLGAVIDNGLIAAHWLDFGNQLFAAGTAGFGPSSSLGGAGTIEAQAGGSIEFGAPLNAGSLTLQADAGATMAFDSGVAAGPTVTLAGQDTLRIAGSHAIAFGAEITGFDTSDTILLALPNVTSAVASGGTLALFNGDSEVGALLVAAASIGQLFPVSTTSGGLTRIVLAAPGPGTISPGTTAADSYSWIGPLAGDWSNAANWQDSTANADPASIAPGSLDLVTIEAPTTVTQIITGNARAAGLVVGGDLAVVGTIRTGTLTVGAGSLSVTAGGTLVAGTADVTGSLAATDGGCLQAAALSLDAAGASATIDATSTLEIGTAGGTPAGLAVDPGSTLQVASGNSLVPAFLLGVVTDNGLITADALDFGNQLFQPGTAGTGPASSLGGAGTIEAQAGGSIEFGAPIGGASLTIQADQGATLVFDSTVAAGSIVMLAGSDTVRINATIAFAAAIIGVDTTDTLLLAGPTITSAVAAAGTLSLYDGDTPVGTLAIPAATLGRLFPATPAGSGLTQIVLAPPGSGTISPGTTAADAYSWIGPLAGDWSDPANWQDGTANADPASIAPGSLDLVTIEAPTTVTQIVTGNGRAASLTLSGDLSFLGTITAGSADISGTVAVQGAAASLTVGGTLLLSGSLTPSDGAAIRLGGLDLDGAGAGLVIDAPSTLEIGNAGNPPAGLAIDPGATLQVSAGSSLLPAYLLGAVTDNGRIDADWLDFGNQFFTAGTAAFGPTSSLAGAGTIEDLAGGRIEFGAPVTAAVAILADAGATLAFDNPVAAGSTIALAGNNLLQIGSAALSGFAAGITGFDVSDTLLISGATITTAVASGGSLVLGNGTGVVASLALAGDFASQGFTVEPLSSTQAQVMLADQGSPSPGTTLPDSYSWAGPLAGAWHTAANWADTTASQSPAATAPGRHDLVAIDNAGSTALVISGAGDAASLAVQGPVTLTGPVNAGSLAVTAGTLTISGALRAGMASSSGAIQLTGFGADFTGIQPLTLTGAAATLALSDQAEAAFPAVALDGSGVVLSADSTSTLAIGTTGTTTAAGVVIIAGTTLSAPGPDPTQPDALLGTVVDDGLVTATWLDIGNTAFQPGTSGPAGNLQGSGTIAVQPGGMAAFESPVTQPGLTIAAAAGATLRFDAAVTAGTTVALTGGTDVLQIGSLGATALPGFAAEIAGLDATDTLLIDGPALTAADPGNGVLVLRNGASIAGTLALAGAVAGQSFITTPLSATQSRITLSAQSGPGGIGPGTPMADDYLWTGPTTGDWNTAANWQDISQGTPATLAPGSLDLVTIDTTASTLQFIRGLGDAASLTLAGANTVTGSFTVGTLNAGGTLTVGDGAGMTAGRAVLAGATLAVDAAGTLEIGTAATAAPGALTVDAGATLSASGPSTPSQFQGAVTDNGLITATHLLIGTPQTPADLTGTGSIQAQPGGTVEFADMITGSLALQAAAGATLQFDAGVAAGATITLAGTNDVLAIGTLSSFAAEITGFDLTDTLLLNGPSIDTATENNGTLTLRDAGAFVASLLLTGSHAHRAFVAAATSPTQTAITAINTACFAAGTRIRTPAADIPVEQLRPGQRVRLAHGGEAKIIWLGHRHLDCRKHPRPQDVMPVRIRAGAFGPQRPARELCLSPDHAVFHNGVLIPVRYLINGRTIRQEPVADITYHHVELARHAVILAENLPCESYLDTGNRSAFANGGPAIALHPDFSPRRWETAACAPLVTAGPRLAETQAALLVHAARHGHHLTDNADPHLLVAGRRIDPVRHGNELRFALPPRADHARLVSRIFTPAHTIPGHQDPRTLGIAVSNLCLDFNPMDPRHLTDGWLIDAWRWTTGNAGITLGGARELRCDLAVTGRYWAPKRQGQRTSHG